MKASQALSITCIDECLRRVRFRGLEFYAALKKIAVSLAIVG